MLLLCTSVQIFVLCCDSILWFKTSKSVASFLFSRPIISRRLEWQFHSSEHVSILSSCPPNSTTRKRSENVPNEELTCSNLSNKRLCLACTVYFYVPLICLDRTFSGDMNVKRKCRDWTIGRGINGDGFNSKLAMVKVCSTWPLVNKNDHSKKIWSGSSDPTVTSDPL